MAQQPIGGDAIDLSNIQGDVLLGFPKKTEVFIFFHIDDARVKQFRINLKKIMPHITTSAGVQAKRNEIDDWRRSGRSGLVPTSLVNIAFSSKGVQKICQSIGVGGSFGDSLFDAGMAAGLGELGDVTSEWNRGFLENDIDGVLLLAGDNIPRLVDELFKIKNLLQMDAPNAPVHQLFMLNGWTRPGNMSGHEHFGFLDGVSLPFINGIGTHHPGQIAIDPGRLLIGHRGDDNGPGSNPIPRPDWARDGSIMCLRKLDQLVPEFQHFLDTNPGRIPSDLFGACLVGRWKSGAPLELAPNSDDPTLAGDANRNNNFTFPSGNESICPFAAHIRKANPRNDIPNVSTHMLMRRGIQFGDEVTAHEKSSGRSDPNHARGLMFVCYQSNLSNGFHFVQTAWANNPNFVRPEIGFDPIIGQKGDGVLSGKGFNRTNPSQLFQWDKFVVSRGGEYFFSPSISTLRDRFGCDY